MSFPEQWNSVRCACCAGLSDDGVESGESSAEAGGQPRQRHERGTDSSTIDYVRAKTGNRSSWVAVRWASLTKHSMSICNAP